jgi:RND family efflux transporter MFP subunit
MTQENNEDHSRVPTDFDPQTGSKVKLLALGAAIGLFLGFLAVGFSQHAKESSLAKEARDAINELPTVDVAVAHAAPAFETLTLPGETRAWYETTLHARVNGYVSKWMADIGDHVAQGQVLATIDTPDLDAQLSAAKAKLKASQAEVKVAQSQAEFAKTDYDRIWNAPKGVVSDQERDQSKAQLDSGNARVAAAQSQVRLSRADVDNLAALTQFKQVTAPFDGIVTKRNIDVGQLVTAGSTTNTTSLYNIAQSDKIRVFVRVPESASARMKEGTPVQVTVDEIPGKVFEGTVARSAEEINTTSNTMRVEADFSNPDLKLLPGMYVHANFQLGQKGLVEIPASALVFRSSGPQVAVIDPDGRVDFRGVTIGSDEGDVVEINKGVSVGDRVALNIGDQIADGDRVKTNIAQDIAGFSKKAKPEQKVLAPTLENNSSGKIYRD